ncbi:NAC domain containing protein [Parasponia andersonii]|uniref:NAC domain containing protein n=1 Tax=Parasponia andersonii TaxID=3476 RepID=A0A2P5AIV1_PARAD|nr:NAC domain containing protein [Parasponia andersonii]
MCPPAAARSHDTGFSFTDKDVFVRLEEIMNGSPLPSNVISDVNPYQHKPAHLPDGIWFYIGSEVNKNANFGYWRTTGEASQIFSNSSITVWRSTLEFYEVQAPHGHKTGWMMQEYWITRKILSKNNNAKETSLLCNVFFVGEEKPNHEKPQKMTQADMAIQSTESVVQKSENYTGQGSTSKPQMGEDNETENEERFPANRMDIVPEIDDLSGGDYLELLDLQNPASPSSSSDSSCVTMSSDECFDVLDLLRDLESEKGHSMVQNNAGCKLSVFASSRPAEVVMHPASTGTLDKSPSQEILVNNRSVSGSAISSKTSDKKVLKNANKNQKPDFRNEVTSSTSQNRFMSLGGNTTAAGEDKKEARGRMKKLKKKYLCFMPF